VDFDKAKAAAMKILGKDANFPKLPGSLSKDEEAVQKAGAEAVKARDDFEAKLLALKKALGDKLDTADTYKDIFEGTDFGLDAKDAKQKKQIDDATKVLTAPLTEDMKDLEKQKSVMDQTIKQIAGIAKSLDVS
jgi:hypothetical protein